jgi:hypothetical protein
MARPAWRGQQEGWFPCKIACRASLRIASATNATGRRSSVAPVNAMVSHSGRLSRNPLTVMGQASPEQMQCATLRLSCANRGFYFLYWRM